MARSRKSEKENLENRIENETAAEEQVKEETPETEAEGQDEEKKADEKPDLSEELEKVTEELEKYKDLYLRARADFENNRKRNEGIRQTSYTDGKTDAVEKILPVGDNFERALDAAKDDEAIRAGIELIQKQFEKALTDLGVTEIDALGKPFDPNLHNAVMQQPAGEGEEHGTVKKVLLKGYKIGDKVVRHSMVIVAE